MSGSSTTKQLPPQHQVFINFRGVELRNSFVSHLVKALTSNNINVYNDEHEVKSQMLDILFERIEESRIALVILSERYTESRWLLRELARIKDCVEKGKMVAIPIFYNVDPSTVEHQRGQFGDAFRDLVESDAMKKKEWENAMKWISSLMGITLDAKSPESDKIKEIVDMVQKLLNNIPSEGSQKASVDPSENSDIQTSLGGEDEVTFGIEESLKDLEDKLDLTDKKTRIIGVVGMPGIGKTTLLKELFKIWYPKFTRRALIHQIRVKSMDPGLDYLPQMLLNELLEDPQIDDIEDPYKKYKDELLNRKILVILDDVSKREQIVALLGRRDWISEGSRIVIATSDMSLTDDLVDDTYMVQNLNHRDSLKLFQYYAFDDYQANPPKEDFMQLSEGFLHYARGHPLALKILSGELRGKKKEFWDLRLMNLAQSPSPYIGSIFKVTYDELTQEQKEAFHDIACFRSQDLDYVESLLDSSEAVKVLMNKFLINICDGRVEMHNLLYTFLRDLELKASIHSSRKERRLWRHQDIIKKGEINVLHNKMRGAAIRGIFLDLSEVMGETSLDSDHFKNMCNLRYLKFYNSHCPQECKTDNKINLPDGLNLPLEEIRCLHWLKFPLEELPKAFNPINLIDLKLPYSEIERLWEGIKDIPKLKWVDLNHSKKLSTLSGLSRARSLQRLNLEGCTALETFPHDMVEMKSLAFLNMKGCTSLKSLPVMNLISLKTLILSGCSKFKDFPFISENLEALYLDGTAISQLPDNVVKLKRLILLTMKDCKSLKNIPTCVGELEALQKLVLSGCSDLKDFPEINKSSISILLLDGTSIKTMPQLPSVQYLCLSRNEQINGLPAGMNQLSHLTRLDLKYCTSLTYIPELPPNLQYLDVDGCSSLKTVAKPLARIMPTMQNHCIFNFTNCGSLERAAKEEITSYAQRKFQSLSDARKHYSEGLSSEALFSTCFPGCEVPSWFCHEGFGSLLKLKLLPHWHDKNLSGIALCAIVSFLDDQYQISGFSVTCTFKIKVEDKSWIPFTCPVGTWTSEGDEKNKIESDHVFIAYISCPHTIRCLEDENSDKCNFTEASLEFTATGGTSEIGKFTVSRCGLSLVHAKDKNKNSSSEAKYDMPVEVSFQEPQHGMLEEKRNLEYQKGMIDCQRKSEKMEGVDLYSVAQTCGANRNPKVAEAKSRRDDGLSRNKDDTYLGETNSNATSKLQDSAEINKVEPVNEEKKQETVSESSTMVTYDKLPPEHKVFINFCGAEMRHGFVGDLVEDLKRDGVKIFIDLDEFLCGGLTKPLFKGIEESRIALVIFSRRYTESRWCLNELVKIKELMDERKLLVIPIFYKVDQLEVTQLKGDFGVKFWNLWRINRDSHIIKWKEALGSFASSKGIYLKENGSESENITLTVKEVWERVLLSKGENPSLFLSTEKGKSTDLPIGKGAKHETYLNKCHLFGMEQHMEQLERKLEFDCKETRIIGVVGMPGIGKTALAMMLHEKWSCKFIRSVPLLGIRKMSEQYEPEWLRRTFLEVLLERKLPEISEKTTHEFLKVELLQKKIFAVLDDVSNKTQLDFLLGDLGWIKKGSKIVITTCDKSLLEGFSHDNYVVPQLNYKDSFQLFTYHAFDQIFSPTKIFDELSKMFVEYARGHPLALKILGRELCGRDKAYWEKKLDILMESSNMLTQYVRRFSIDQLNDHQKDVFLDILYFFNSEDEYFVKSLLDSGDPDSNDAVSEVIDLANKFLITISDGRVEMNHLLYMFGKDLSSPERYRQWNYKNIINMPTEMEKAEANCVRGISVDMSKVAQIIPLQRMAFTNMLHLRYLKIYDSSCPRQCKAYCKLSFPHGLECPLEEIRYLHWVKFPLEELPPDFRPENLVDLRLPYSKIERVWEGVKDTPRLKWVDLRHSSKLLDLSALSKAENLQRLNLAGCTVLNELPAEIQNMKSLVFLNLRGCISLRSLPKMNLITLQTLILSDCSNLKEFQLISESVKFLHLDGTAIKGLPLAIQNLQRLVVLNLKDCKLLECLPKCLGEIKSLEELILSGCSRLKNLSDVRESMKHLQSLLIDRIGAKEMPNLLCVSKANDQASTDMFVEPTGPSKWPLSVNGVFSLRRLCLSGNDFVSLQPDIEKLYNLKWLDVKHCKKLRCVPMLPPRLQYFDAHGCDSLERVANPLALPVLSEHIPASFNFSKCNKLDQEAKDSIISYTRWRSQLGLDELIRYNGGVVLEALIGTCLPGWEVPVWFSHQASGSVLEPKLPPHWCNNQFTGISLCAVISFPADHERRNRLLVKCNCVFNNEDGSHIRFSCTIGGWSEPSSTPGKCEPSHVFIGYTSLLNIKKHAEEEVEEGFSHTKASFEFQVTDGIQVIGGCEVLKCGFSLVYATNERENMCWDAKAVVVSENIENNPGEARSFGNSGSDHDEFFVRSLLDSEDPEAMSEVRDLADKFVITFSGGRVEMHDQLHTLGKDLGSPGKLRLQNYKAIINTLTEMKQSEANNVRGIFLDMSEITKSIALDSMFFAEMLNLQYLKIYDSCCPRKCKATCNLYFPDGVEFPLEEVRYLHWVKLPLQELPADFRPKSLVDLRLPYSNIERVWKGVKDVPQLKWVDLSHSSKLLDLSALSKAENLQRLNLEGCTSLDELPVEIQNMKSLVFLNLRGCICLCYLPKMNLISLKTLILSDCSNLEEFELISESVEFLHLDGTAIKGLPLTIQNLQRLVVLNLKNCKMLECLPKCLGELKALEELILSGCSRLKNLPDVRESMKHLQSLLIDRIGAKEMPNISCVSNANDQASIDMSVEPMGPRKWPLGVNGVSTLRRLCLSGNDFVSLQPDIEKLYNLKWLDVKHCKKLRCVPMLPPRLQYFDAHGCDSLERVANPLADPMLSEQIHATFSFSNCYNLDQDAKDNIVSYIRLKSQLMLDELSRYNTGLVLEVLIGTCFPGWEVPSWFIHHASGSELNLKLPPHWCDNRFTGICLCAVIVFHGNHDQRKHVLVKCNFKFKNEDGSIISFSCSVGGWSEPSDTPRKIESSHVFIGFTSLLHINKIAEEDDEEKCFSTETSIKFQVTDGTEEIKGSEVLKCGFSLLYAPEERRNICRISKTCNSKGG